MAIDNYTDLLSAVAKRLHRTDLTDQIVDYIDIAEKRLNRELNLTSMEIEVTLTATIGSRSLTIPSLFGIPIALYLTTYLPRLELQYRLPEDMQVFPANGPSKEWTIDGTFIKTNSPADREYTYTLRYVAESDLASTATNSLLSKYPELYLYAALIEASADIRDQGLAAIAVGRYREALQECKDDINSNRSIANLTTELSTRSTGNIIRGF
jgi:hypothetical protein